MRKAYDWFVGGGWKYVLGGVLAVATLGMALRFFNPWAPVKDELEAAREKGVVHGFEEAAKLVDPEIASSHVKANALKEVAETHEAKAAQLAALAASSQNPPLPSDVDELVKKLNEVKE